MRIFRTVVNKGETLFEAIVRAQLDTVRNGFDGYEVVCERCGQPIGDHKDPRDCGIWQKELGNANSR